MKVAVVELCSRKVDRLWCRHPKRRPFLELLKLCVGSSSDSRVEIGEVVGRCNRVLVPPA